MKAIKEYNSKKKKIEGKNKTEVAKLQDAFEEKQKAYKKAKSELKDSKRKSRRLKMQIEDKTDKKEAYLATLEVLGMQCDGSTNVGSNKTMANGSEETKAITSKAAKVDKELKVLSAEMDQFVLI